MTISATKSRWEYTGDASTTVFAYTNKIFADADLEVRSDGVLQALTTNYTVSGAGVVTGGNVTYVTAPANGVKIVIIRVVADTQGTEYPAGGSLPSGVIEKDIDRRTIVSQQQAEKIRRAIKFAVTSDKTDIEIPDPEAGKILRWNSAADALENVDAQGSGSLTTPVSIADGGTGGTTASAARTNLDVDVARSLALFNLAL